jgi:hypothetical protein
MEKLVIDDCNNLHQVQLRIKNIIDSKGPGSWITNIQVAAALQDACTEGAVASVPRTIEAQEGIYQFLEYNSIKFYVDPYMSWNDNRLIYITEADGKSLKKKKKNMPYTEIKIETKAPLI